MSVKDSLYRLAAHLATTDTGRALAQIGESVVQVPEIYQGAKEGIAEGRKIWQEGLDTIVAKPPARRMIRGAKRVTKKIEEKINVPAKVSVGSEVVQSAKRIGANPRFLLKLGQAESSLRANAKPPKGSATGVFQFIDSTWKGLIERHGHKYGITSDIADRTNVTHSTYMARELMEENRKEFKDSFGEEPTDGEHYLMWFMGSGRGRKFKQLLNQKPDHAAADYFKREAKYNPRIFFRGERKRSIKEVMDILNKKVSSEENFDLLAKYGAADMEES